MEEPKKDEKLKRALGPLGLVAALAVVVLAGLVVGSRFLERPVSYGASRTTTPGQNTPTSATPGEVPTISMAEVRDKLNTGADITIVDVRSITEYNKFHLPGALSIPYGELNNRYTELPRQGEIITYSCSA